MKLSLDVKKYMTNEKGITLILVLILIVVMSVLTVSLIGVTATNLKVSSGERDNQSAYYIAESGINLHINSIKENLDKESVDEIIGPLPNETIYSNFEPQQGIEPRAIVTIDETNMDGVYKITSIGEIGNRSRVVEVTFTLPMSEGESGPPIFIPSDMAVFSNSTIKLDGSTSINGSVGTVSDNPGSITIAGGGGNRITGDIFVGGNLNNVISKPNGVTLRDPKVIQNSFDYTLPQFPNFPELTTPANGGPISNGNLHVGPWPFQGYTFSEDAHFNTIIVDSNTTLTIDVGGENEHRKIRVNNLHLRQGHIRLVGEGKLTLYIENQFTFQSTNRINVTHSGDQNEIKDVTDQLNIFYSGSNKLEVGGQSQIFGSIYINHADLDIGASATFTGHIISGGNKVEISGDSKNNTRVLFAPLAKVEMTGSSQVRGTIISKEYEASGGGIRVDYQEIDQDSLIPFFPGNGSGDEETPTFNFELQTPTVEK
ncbi:pilus assembly PilX N-terminal domain-containing protein [Evansella cellulosilytica]|uniref:Uncharacterized protein n=1 Tax=Evansella cellulosilytica (strain ATCC 21833 / DSM 2522 / FERM P-1141 / JCM 9156 / N-4) TaxID=649639 RepID=E6TZP3_EVAC2|nr:pilus assembly PilX N-terminal domain-containing protein [Evansella cellulosilytica]ADU31349.1 hypothetical protein Bcell_3106 [Evansella cellulosilytica DSM 2522]